MDHTMSTFETQQTEIVKESISPKLARMRERAWEEAKAKVKSDGLYGAHGCPVDACGSLGRVFSVLDVVDLEDFFRTLDAAVDV
ncbi:hypothetical protein pkur_cds_234 [Pandoravirus kuranda]|uniref:Uncharacterized protein n=2 Tax=Pandoravirus TaxID=2060084 RepID=A0AA95EI51_9VIRU|nr:hypothetical protein pneo_cds_260 [Pandoravirus neocaledonia]AVK75867.1 hypothetical protein pneo_cds_260 [Pandoravirus neocaledonia]WBR14409.1 hypothetical protein pkur_cds_234 [Pandoravirus kuranda]